ncbi:hypothetical protein [Methanobrevibacter sp.]|uniref:hypothetical protein n=1 Tax=Methanobrevibacter sp. TaxID=66852 RepID=UPI00387019D2
MENRNLMIILLAVIVVIAVVAGVMLLNPINAKEPTKIKITSDNEQYENEGELSIKLTDLNKTPISKEIVNITITNKKGKVVVDEVVKTNSKGKAKLDLNLKKGKYKVNVSYDGNGNFTGNNTTQKLTIKEKEVIESESSSSSGGSSSDDYVYSSQKGDYVKASGQMETDSHGNSVYTYQGSDGVIYEKYYDSNGKEISTEDYYR